MKELQLLFQEWICFSYGRQKKKKKAFFVGHKTDCSTTVLHHVNHTRLGKAQVQEYNNLTSALAYQRSSGLIRLISL